MASRMWILAVLAAAGAAGMGAAGCEGGRFAGDLSALWDADGGGDARDAAEEDRMPPSWDVGPGCITDGDCPKWDVPLFCDQNTRHCYDYKEGRCDDEHAFCPSLGWCSNGFCICSPDRPEMCWPGMICDLVAICCNPAYSDCP